MKLFINILFIFLIFTLNGFAQATQQACKFKVFPKDSINLKGYYRTSLINIEVKKGEKIASIGAGMGNQEVQLSIFNEGIVWTLQDIDSTVLNQKQFEEVLHYFENIMKKSIRAEFSIVIGNEKKTNLQEDTFDKVLIINTYHEITERASILADVHRALKKNGKVIIVESMAKKKGDLHWGCHDLKLFETDFLKEMETFNFKFLNKINRNKSNSWSYYTFESI